MSGLEVCVYFYRACLTIYLNFDIAKERRLFDFVCWNSRLFSHLQATSAKVDLQCCLELYNLAVRASERLQERKRTGDERSLSSGELPTKTICPCNKQECDCKQSCHNRSASLDSPVNIYYLLLLTCKTHNVCIDHTVILIRL